MDCNAWASQLRSEYPAPSSAADVWVPPRRFPQADSPSRTTTAAATTDRTTRGELFFIEEILAAQGEKGVKRVYGSGKLALRQAYGEPRAPLGGMAGLDLPAEPGHQPRGQGKPHPASDLADALVPLVERAPLEHHSQVVIGKAGP